MFYSLWAAGPILNGASSSMMLFTVPLVLLGIFRYQLLSDVNYASKIKKGNIFLTEKPEEILIKDKGIRSIVILWLLITIFIGLNS